MMVRMKMMFRMMSVANPTVFHPLNQYEVSHGGR